MRRAILAGTVLAALAACKGEPELQGIEPLEEPKPAASAPVRKAALTAASCRDADPCPAGCYQGPSVCNGKFCTRDRICAEPGYDPQVKKEGQDSLSMMRPPENDGGLPSISPGDAPSSRKGAQPTGLDMIREGGETDDSMVGVKPPEE